MGGKRHGGKRVTSVEAHALFHSIMSDIGQDNPAGVPVDAVLAGSYRRGKPDSGDLDIVIIPQDEAKFDAWCTDNFGALKNGAIARTGLVNGIQVEFYIATPANWGTFLQMWTGSMYHNMSLRRKAKAKGYSLSQYGFKSVDGYLHTCKTEAEVYSFLDIPWKDPAKR